MPHPWSTASSPVAAQAAAAPRTLPDSAQPTWPQGIASNAPAPTPTPWPSVGSIAAALANPRR